MINANIMVTEQAFKWKNIKMHFINMHTQEEKFHTVSVTDVGQLIMSGCLLVMGNSH